ncbi:hypothetical protein [Niabella drilacis]|uniref:Uncharacterized protein n=1 Tax=Niabella drilacis (strain DSM 25811 / CCM 8410 / CCUG 62505 / LMG 26954 / E90) TaxID=1285928 RepID=A0A1G6LYG8_NIADE|nr:hypothetical protein [Niabella drilacis]SDC48313.1 hypothetical protein SAMN04487894_102499 [Niabella drilacis]
MNSFKHLFSPYGICHTKQYPMTGFQHFSPGKIIYARIFLYFMFITHSDLNGKPKKFVLSPAGAAGTPQELMNE